MTRSPDIDEQQEDCTPPIAIPPEVIKRYSATRDPDSEQDIARYVEYESREHVQHVELIKTEYIAGDQYKIWDVTTNDDRWWVITNITNLYSQRIFPSLDYTISFHVGLMMRMASRPSQIDARQPHLLDSAFRQLDQVSDALDRASEVQEYQAIGMQLRECLLSMVHTFKIIANLEGEGPKQADFKAWADLAIGAAYAGGRRKELRSLLKAVAEKTWSYVNWLTHYREAGKLEAAIAYQECGTFAGHIAQTVDAAKNTIKDSCPNCGSNKVRSHYDVRIDRENKTYLTCGVCPWNTHPDGEERSFETSALELLQREAGR